MGVICSNLLAPVIRRAAAFWMTWSLCSNWLLIFSLLNSERVCGGSWIKTSTSPQICSRTVLRHAVVHWLFYCVTDVSPSGECIRLLGCQRSAAKLLRFREAFCDRLVFKVISEFRYWEPEYMSAICEEWVKVALSECLWFIRPLKSLMQICLMVVISLLVSLLLTTMWIRC